MDKHGKDLKDNGRAMLKLQAACEHAKHTLSVSTRAVVEVDALADGVDFRKLVNQASFESCVVCTASLALRTRSTLVRPARLTFPESNLDIYAC